jgi:hypothetical protein
MRTKLKLNAPLESPGVFWDPAQAETTFGAQLLRGEKRRIVLTAMPKRAGVIDLMRAFDGPSVLAPPELLGTIKHGICTLLGLVATSGDSYVDARGADAPGFTTDKYLVSTCVVGLNLRNSAAPAIKSARVTYSGLKGWVRAPREMAVSEDRVSLTYPKVTPIIEMAPDSEGTRLIVESHYHLRSRTSGSDNARSDLHFTFQSSELRRFEWFWMATVGLESFLSACISSSVRLNSMLLTDITGESGWVVRSRVYEADKPYRPAMIRCDGSQLAAALQVWMKNRRILEPFERLVYGTMRSSDMTVETEFLSLAQAIESFHRLTDDRTVLPRGEFDKIRKSVSAIIEERTTGQIAERLKESIMFANEPSFQNRIKSLLQRIPPEIVERLLGDPLQFEQSLRQTRNHLTHLGGKAGKKVISDVGSLYLINQKLHALLRFLVLTHLRFPPGLVFDPIFQQSRRMTVL